MNRRETTLALAAFATAPLIARAQQPARPARVAMLGINNPDVGAPFVEGVKQGMRERGYVEGKDYVLELRWGFGKLERLPDLAREIVALKPDVFLASATPVAVAALKATATIPIVAINVSDPVGSGLAVSLARPGRNVTGISFLQGDLGAKRLELVLAAAPGSSRVAALWNPSSLSTDAVVKKLESAAQRAKVSLLTLETRTPADLDEAFARMVRDKVAALVVPSDALFQSQMRRISDLATRHRIATIFPSREFAEAGGLMSYGQNQAAGWAYAATFIDKILKGAKPGDLPFEQSTTFEFVISLKSARALGIVLPQSLLLRADEVIE